MTRDMTSTSWKTPAPAGVFLLITCNTTNLQILITHRHEMREVYSPKNDCLYMTPDHTTTAASARATTSIPRHTPPLLLPKTMAIRLSEICSRHRPQPLSLATRLRYSFPLPAPLPYIVSSASS